MAEQHENSNTNLAERHNEHHDNVDNNVLENEDHEVLEKIHQQFREHEKENTPQPFLMGWNWINLREEK